MTHTVYDTETSGMVRWKDPSHMPWQPHIVEIAWVKYTEDGTETGAYHALIKPDGWDIEPEAQAVHGITKERAMDEGVPEQEVVHQWVEQQRKTNLRIAHNPYFDDRIMKIAMLRAGYSRADIDVILAQPKFDTCRAATKIINLAPSKKMAAANMKMAKSPKLVECAAHFFDVDTKGAHGALWDAQMCGRLYFHMRTLAKAA